MRTPSRLEVSVFSPLGAAGVLTSGGGVRELPQPARAAARTTTAASRRLLTRAILPARLRRDGARPPGRGSTMAAMTGRTFWRGFGVVLLVALVARLAVIVATSDFRPVTDAADYDRHAVSLVQNGNYPPSAIRPQGGPTAFRPPLFPLVLAAVYEVRRVSS